MFEALVVIVHVPNQIIFPTVHPSADGSCMQVLVLRLQTADSIEEHIYDVATQKRNIADRSITGGFFDGKTDAQERRAYLLELLGKKSSHSRRYFN